MRMKAPKKGSCNTIAPLELPHAFHSVFPSDQEHMVINRFSSLGHLLFLLFLYDHDQQCFSNFTGRLPNISWGILELL